VADVSLKAAYLIIAHHQPEHLARLIKALDCEWAWFFIHIDSKLDTKVYRRLVPEQENIVFLKNPSRCSVNWGGFSIVEAVLFLLSEAYDSGVDFERFCLLSGSDFPIKSLGKIREMFESNVEYMRVDRKLSYPEENSHTKYIRYHYFTDSNSLQDREQSGNIIREPYAKLDLYHGSAWWSLTRKCVDHIIDFLEINPDYTDFHRTTFCPDEIYFHSIVKASPFAENLIHDYENASNEKYNSRSNKHGCHYIDWNEKNETLPKTLKSGDFYQVINSGMLFARKMDTIHSSSLISDIEELIKNDGRKCQQERKDERTLIVFQTHILTQPILDEFLRIQAVADRQTTVKLFYDNTASDFDFSLLRCEEDFFLFNRKDVFDFFNIECISDNFYGNANLPLLYFSCQNPEYKFYWVVEYDVRFSGEWKFFIDSFRSTDADLLGTTLCSKEFYPEWFHWDSVEPPETEDSLEFIRGFFPVVRYSQLACRLLVTAYHDGWRGHFEGLVPTVLYSRGCTIEDIGGDGEFTPVERLKLFYSNSPGKWSLSPGTFVYRPDVSLQTIVPDTLYHPVKSQAVWERYLSFRSSRKYNTCLTGRRTIHEQKYIFVVSHMRSYSSLLCNILGSNIDICGYAESHISYHDRQLVNRLHEFVRKTTGEFELSHYILDKVLHNEYEIRNDMLRDNHFRFIFLLRQPYESISSILRMRNNFSTDQPDSDQIDNAVRYYKERLKLMMDMAERVCENALFFSADDIVKKTRQTLNTLSGWLGLSEPLTSNYSIFSHTGRPGYGDSSTNILRGKVVVKQKIGSSYKIDASILDECDRLYGQCHSVLKGLNESTGMNH